MLSQQRRRCFILFVQTAKTDRSADKFHFTSLAMLQLLDQPQMVHLFIGQDLGHIVKRACRDIVFCESVQPVAAIARDEYLSELSLQFFIVPPACRAIFESRVVRKLWTIHSFEET